jgi:glycosyltransferase involved in cell wall biosynthesis
VSLHRLPRNGGKGAAVIAGMRAAASAGASHVLQIDADGQHDAADVPRFLAEAAAHPHAVVNGRPVYDESVPRGRLLGRYATHVWVWINTLSFDIADSMCGFRVYPLAATLAMLQRERVGLRMDFDVEVIVRLHWAGLEVRNLPTHVTYPLDGVSHFDLWRDNVRISRMHARLFFGMLLRMPRLLARRVRAMVRG